MRFHGLPSELTFAKDDEAVFAHPQVAGVGGRPDGVCPVDEAVEIAGCVPPSGELGELLAAQVGWRGL